MAKKKAKKVASAKKPSKYVYRYQDSVTGRFVPKAYADANPGSTQGHKRVRVSTAQARKIDADALPAQASDATATHDAPPGVQ